MPRVEKHTEGGIGRDPEEIVFKDNGKVKWDPEGSLVESTLDRNQELIMKMVRKGRNPDAPRSEQKTPWKGQGKDKYEKVVVILPSLVRNGNSEGGGSQM
ncbi:hypothetical protein chiPu_0016680 [Chiloscyllium punctatum]|uniref:Uncharacterized protein n=1 Tax=Chiloscyllium punctatum TaxID=137246 RepID=A0A401T692_CHIPU|nr:hypothetical protein [Chiloscyllium punctatum]